MIEILCRIRELPFQGEQAEKKVLKKTMLYLSILFGVDE